MADAVTVGVREAVRVGVGVRVAVAVKAGIEVFAGLDVRVAVLTGGLYGWEAKVAVGYVLRVCVGSREAVTAGVGSSGVTVGPEEAGEEAGKRPSGVMVGTGEDSAARRVPTRFTEGSTAGTSVMIWIRMFSLMAGISPERGSRL